jgi:hypothetical protein
MKKYLFSLLLASGCAHLTAQDKSELAQYAAQQEACLAAHVGDQASTDDCLQKVKDQWTAKWNARFDGGFGDAQ